VGGDESQPHADNEPEDVLHGCSLD
jgi:hypothetical protein